MSITAVERLDAMQPDELPKLFEPENIAALAQLAHTDKVRYARLVQKWHSSGFPLIDDLKQAVRDHTAKLIETKQRLAAKSVAPSKEWPRALDYTRRNSAGVARLFTESRPGKLIYSNGTFYDLRTNGVWVELCDDSLQAEIRATDPKDIISGQNMKAATQAIRPLVNCKARPFEWIAKPEGAPDAKDTVLFRNGLLDLRTYTLLPLNGDYFATAVPPYDYDPGAKCDFWLKWLDERLDKDVHVTLQEIMGYTMVPDNSIQRYAAFIGQSRAGKGTVLNLIENLVGADHVYNRALANFAEQFGLAEISGKRLIVISDARGVKSAGHNRALERVLALTGGDTMGFEQKYKGSYQLKPVAFLLVLANSQISWHDNSGALANRQITIPFMRSFEGAEDMGIRDKLQGEMPGIANWALEGLRRLKAAGNHFTMTATLLKEKEALRPGQSGEEVRDMSRKC